MIAPKGIASARAKPMPVKPVIPSSRLIRPARTPARMPSVIPKFSSVPEMMEGTIASEKNAYMPKRLIMSENRIVIS